MKCPTCKGTGYIPFTKPDGSVSQYARQTCPDCGGYSHERDYVDANMPDQRPDDFDFPCSDTWRGYYNGGHQVFEADEQASVPSSAPPENLSDRRWASVQQLRAQVNYLNKKVTEMRIERKKKRGEY